jgi:hypothetical protein
MVIHPTENFDAAPAAAVSEKRSRVFFAELDDPVLLG